MTFHDNDTINGHFILGFDSSICGWLRDKILPRIFNAPAEYSKPDKDKASNETLLHEPEKYTSTLPSAPPPSTVVLFCPLPGEDCHLKWWLRKLFADHLDIFYQYEEMGNNECTQMQLKFEGLPNHSGFVTTSKVRGTGIYLTAANLAIISQKFCILNEQCQGFVQVVQPGQIRVPHTWLLNTGPSGYDNRASDLHQHSGVGRLRVLHGLMSNLNITTSM